MEVESTERNKLNHSIKNELDTHQQEVYFDEVQRRRNERVESGEGRNVPYTERLEILEDIKEGKIKKKKEYESPFSDVDPEKMERDFEAAGRPMKGAKDD